MYKKNVHNKYTTSVTSRIYINTPPHAHTNIFVREKVFVIPLCIYHSHTYIHSFSMKVHQPLPVISKCCARNVPIIFGYPSCSRIIANSDILSQHIKLNVQYCQIYLVLATIFRKMCQCPLFSSLMVHISFW